MPEPAADAAPAVTPTAEQLQALLRLQTADSLVRRLELRMSHLPEQAALDAAAENAAGVRAEHDAQRVDLELVVSHAEKLENDVNLLTQRRDRERSRMYGGEVTSPRELQQMRAELDGIERRMRDAEDELLTVMERREQAEATLEELAQQRAVLDAEGVALTQARDEAARDILAELETARARREQERALIPPDVLERYEAVRDRNGGVGVGTLEHGLCTGCRMELTALEIADLRDGPPLQTCPQCQRLIVVLS